MVKLISLDLDGTLLDPQGQITPASKAAIALARAAEIRVVLNTGRPIPEACFFARQGVMIWYLLWEGRRWRTAPLARSSSARTCPKTRGGGCWSCVWAGGSS